MVQCANLRKIRQKWSRSHNIHTKNKLIKKKKKMKFYPTDATAGAVELLLVLVIIQLTLVAEVLNIQHN